jgi:hypothetical protein
VKTRTGARDDVARELRARVKRTLDSLGIRLPAVASTAAGAGKAGGTEETPVIPGVVKQSTPRPPTGGGKK